MIKKRLFILSIFFVPFAIRSQIAMNAQDIAYFNKYQDTLCKLEKLLFYSKDDSIKIKSNKIFIEIFEEVLLNDLSFQFPFDSLKDIARLISPDNKFKIINWDFKRKDGTYHYFGFIQVKNGKNKYELFKLQDHSAVIKNPETHVGDNTKWFGMMYYKIIACGDYYTLLGLDWNDKITSRKFIDILYFKENGQPMFGKDVFKISQKNPKRIMFEYSTEIVMSLKYYDDKGKKLIVFDHLAPKDPFMEGQYQFYGPDFSYDAFKFNKGKWVYEIDFDAKNLKNKNDLIKHKEYKDKDLHLPK